MTSASPPLTARQIVLPLAVLIAMLALWQQLAAHRVFPEWAFPGPADVLQGFREEIGKGSLFRDSIVSLYRVGIGFGLGVVLGVPFGLLLGLRVNARFAFLPAVNFFRNLSPLAWIPFAILWFGLGDTPAIFLIFMAAFFPMVLTTMAAVAHIPAVFYRVARDYDLKGPQLLTAVIVPAILPQVLTALRVTAGMSWVVVVAAELVAGRDGLGFMISDSRSALRNDLVVVGMLVIGALGVVIDRLLVQLTQVPAVRWGYER